MSKGFNPKLQEWLNERGYVSGDWPDNLSGEEKHRADLEVGRGALLNRDGWRTWIDVSTAGAASDKQD